MSGYVTFNKYLYWLVKRCQLNSEPVLTSTNLTQANWIRLKKIVFLFLFFDCYVLWVHLHPLNGVMTTTCMKIMNYKSKCCHSVPHRGLVLLESISYVVSHVSACNVKQITCEKYLYLWFKVRSSTNYKYQSNKNAFI